MAVCLFRGPIRFEIGFMFVLPKARYIPSLLSMHTFLYGRIVQLPVCNVGSPGVGSMGPFQLCHQPPDLWVHPHRVPQGLQEDAEQSGTVSGGRPRSGPIQQVQRHCYQHCPLQNPKLRVLSSGSRTPNPALLCVSVRVLTSLFFRLSLNR